MPKGKFKGILNKVAKKLSNAGGWVGGAAKFVDNIIPDDGSPAEKKKAADAGNIGKVLKTTGGKVGVKLWLANMWAKPSGKLFIIGAPVALILIIVLWRRAVKRYQRSGRKPFRK